MLKSSKSKLNNTQSWINQEVKQHYTESSDTGNY